MNQWFVIKGKSAWDHETITADYVTIEQGTLLFWRKSVQPSIGILGQYSNLFQHDILLRAIKEWKDITIIEKDSEDASNSDK